MKLNQYIFQFKRSLATFDIRYKLESLILFVTNKCDGKCKGCLYWPKLNKKEFRDLTLGEIEEISKSIGNIWQLQISGGEAFLRDDLAEICKTFVKDNRTKLITIPTNGLHTDKIVKITQKILDNCNCKLGISISIDGTEPINYKLRGIKGGFGKSLKTLNKLKKLSARHKNLKVSISTRITNINIKNIPILKKELINIGVTTNHHIFPVRGVLKEKSIRPPTSKEYLNLMRSIDKNTNIKNKVKYYMVSRVLEDCPWPFKCIAGKRIAVIDSDGDVRLCEILEPVGNLRKSNYNFYAIWNSKKADGQRELIKKGKCFAGCTHGCFIWPSLLNNPSQILKLVVKSKRFFP